MAEIKFSCPNCGQNIKGESQWCGQPITCPACTGNMVVPRMGVVGPVLAASQVEVSQPAPASQPQPPPPPPLRDPFQVVPRVAKPAPTSTKKIMAWSAAGLVVVGLIAYAISQSDKWQSAFTKKTDEMAAKSGGGELSHIAKVYEVLDATDPNKMADAQAAATLRAERAEARMKEELKPKPDPTLTMPMPPAAWTLDVTAASIPKGRVNGTSGGTDFHVESIQLIRKPASAVLSFQEGVGTAADHELFISLPVKETDDLAGKSWTVAKEAMSKDALPIIKKWTVNPKYAPSEKQFPKGYAMKLEFPEATRDWQPGRIFLALPDTNQTVLAGEFSIAIPRKIEPDL